jgi:hypothetical protein
MSIYVECDGLVKAPSHLAWCANCGKPSVSYWRCLYCDDERWVVIYTPEEEV